MLDELQIVITKTTSGLSDYVQICSPAAIPVNIVLVAKRIVLADRRPPAESTKPKKKPATQ
jgi:hypothetical protein